MVEDETFVYRMNFKFLIWPAQLVVTMLISTFVADNFIKTILLITFWSASFFPIKRREIYFFIICSLVFSVSNYGALRNSVFEFKQKDFLLMPYNEFLMWGFYCLNSFRLLGKIPNQTLSLKRLLLYIFPFIAAFSIFKSEINLAICLSALLFLGLSFFHEKRNFLFAGYFLTMGILVEGLGITQELWHYPHAHYFEFPLWAPLMWTNIGLIMSQVSIHFFKKVDGAANESFALNPKAQL